MTLPTLSTATAVAALQRGAEARDADPRLQERLGSVQALLRDDLSWVEASLQSAADQAVGPADAAVAHLVRLGGKRVRPLAVLLASACFGPVSQAARELAVVAELVHSATLLHDDVVDEGMERRGAVTARRRFGNGVSVLAGDLLLVEALTRTERAAPLELPRLLATLRQLVEGEIIQLRGRTELDVSEATYEAVLHGKTASLFAWCTRTGARLGGANAALASDFERFGEELGMAFQLVDDALDYSGEETGKTLYADLAEGKLTLPLVLAVARHPELHEPLSRLHSGDRDAALIDQVSRAVIASGACEEVRRRAGLRTERAIAALSSAPDSPARRMLEGVAAELGSRVR